MTIICPNCDSFVYVKFEGEAKIGYCLGCGFEQVIIPADYTTQTKLFRPSLR